MAAPTISQTFSEALKTETRAAPALSEPPVVVVALTHHVCRGISKRRTSSLTA